MQLLLLKDTTKDVLIGLTGGIASGKSTASRHLQSCGYPIVDSDDIAKSLSNSDKTVQAFFQKEFGTQDRTKIREIVFEDLNKRKKLETFLHPIITAESNRRIQELQSKNPNQIIFVVIPLLFEIAAQNRFDQTLAILCSEDIQLKRLIARDDIDNELAKKMLDAQMNNEEKVAHADTVIWNNGSVEELHKNLDDYIKDLS